MRKFKFLLLYLIILYPVAAFSSPIAGISTYTVHENMMNGMQVDVTFSNDSSASGTWGHIGSGSYGVYGTGWSLTYDSDISTDAWDDVNKKYLFDWVLSTNIGIKNFTIKALPGNTVFDIVFKPELTTGSSGGIWLPNGESGTSNSGYVGDLTTFNALFNWEFRDAVYIQGKPAQGEGDLYSTLFIDFTPNSNSGFISTSTTNSNPINFKFVVDTDNVYPIPEPATLLLFGFGLLGLGAMGRKKE